MAALATPLTEFANNGNSRVTTRAIHSASEPKLVIEARKVPAGNQVIAEYRVKTVDSTEDANGELLAQRVTMEAVIRYPINGISGDRGTALSVFRDIVQSTEFGVSVETQGWLT